MGLTFDEIDQDTPFPSAAKEIVDEYKRASDGLIKGLKKNGAMKLFPLKIRLQDKDDMWSRGETRWAHWLLIKFIIVSADCCDEISKIESSRCLWTSKRRWVNYGMQPQE